MREDECEALPPKDRRELHKGKPTAAALLIGAGLMLFPTSGQAEGFKVGVAVSITSPAAKLAQSYINGVNLFLKQAGLKVGDRDINVVTGDTQGNPNGAMAATRRMVEQEQVNMLMGFLNTSEVMSIREYVRDKKVPTIFNAGFKDLTLSLGNEFLLRGGFTESQLIYPLAQWAVENLPIKRVSTLAADFAPGYEFVGAFQETFAYDGREVIQKLWAPVGSQDFAPYVSRIDDTADGLFCFFYGSDAIRLVRQLHSFGLTKKTVLSNFVTDYPHLLGDAGLGLISSQVYNPDFNSPENDKFVSEYRKAFSETPDVYSALGYTELQLVYGALEKLKGAPLTAQGLAESLQKVDLPNTVRGPIKFDDHRGIVENVYVTEVKKAGSNYENAILKIVPAVSQFWRWSPEEFAAKKPFTR